MSAMNWVTPEIRAAMYAHAAEQAPAECCGLLALFAGESSARYVPARNVLKGHPEGDQFEIDDETRFQVEDAGELLAVVHSHPNASANPSMADRVACEKSGVPFLIIGYPSGALVEVAPSGWSAPLEGREYSFGVLDCYSLVQDFYARKLGIELPDFDRDGYWSGGDLYRQNLAAAGFDLVHARSVPEGADLAIGDVLLMRIQSPDVDNHIGVYIGGGFMLHHPYGHPSRKVLFDEPWRRRCSGIARHRSVNAGGSR